MIAAQCGNCDRPVSDGAICSTCSAALARQLAGVPELVEQLLVSYSKQDRLSSAGGGGHRGKLSESPLPVRFDITRVIDRLGNELTTWARDLVEVNGLDEPDPPRRRPHNTAKPDVEAHNLGRGEFGRGRGSAVFPTSSERLDMTCYAASWLAEHLTLLRRHPRGPGSAHSALRGHCARCTGHGSARGAADVRV